MRLVREVADQEEAAVGLEDETHKAEEDQQDDLELSDQDADQVTGGDLGLKLG